jgi:hypothetical protein
LRDGRQIGRCGNGNVHPRICAAKDIAASKKNLSATPARIYEKPGFELFGTLYDHPQGQRRYFMRQRLSQADEARKFGDAESVSTKPP